MAAERAQSAIQRLGHQHYYPCYRERVARRGAQPVHRVRALFPSYIFVFIADAWSELRSANGLRGVIMDGELPARLHEREISALRAKEDAEGFIRLPRISAECFAKGQKVRIESGRFQGFTGLYDGMSSRGREIVLLEMLGASRAVEVAEETALAAA